MKVSCYTIEDFMVSLKTLIADGGGVFENAVRVSISRRPLNESKTKLSVVLQASCVAQPVPEGEYLLEVGVECGTDYDDATKDKTGTETAYEAKKLIEETIKEDGLRVLPGLIGF